MSGAQELPEALGHHLPRVVPEASPMNSSPDAPGHQRGLCQGDNAARPAGALPWDAMSQGQVFAALSAFSGN